MSLISLKLPKCRYLSTREIIIFKELHFQDLSKQFMPSFFPLHWRLILIKKYKQILNLPYSI